MTVRLLTGDCRSILKTLPDVSYQCCVTSPPYYGLRDYGVSGQIGLEPSVDAYVAEMVAVFREVRRVLRDDGTCWLNLGDSYASNGQRGDTRGGFNARYFGSGEPGKNEQTATHLPESTIPTGLKPKDLIGIPWRVAFALQADGWYLRSDIIWNKPNPMPESVRDRPTKSHEYIFLLSSHPRYFFDAEAVKESTSPGSDFGKERPAEAMPSSFGSHRARLGNGSVGDPSGRNIRSVWTIATAPFALAHFATFPPDLAERCIKAGTSERGCCSACGAPWVRVVETHNPSLVAADHENTLGFNNNGRTSNPQSSKSLHRQKGGVYSTAQVLGWQPSCACDADVVPCVVLDPFAGAGTVSLVSERLGRDSIGIELSPAYVAMSEKRIRDDCPMFAAVEVE